MSTDKKPKLKCKVCDKLDCKKLNRTPPAYDNQTMIAKQDGWW